MNPTSHSVRAVAAALGALLTCAGCGTNPSPDASLDASLDAASDAASDASSQMPTPANLEHRAYIACLNSDELFVIDLDNMTILGNVPTLNAGNHMVELNFDHTEAYVSGADSNQIAVVDTRRLVVTQQIHLAGEPTHMALSRDGRLLAVMAEHDNAVAFIDPVSHTEVRRLPGFYTPHFIRYSQDGRYGYVANLGASHITRVDLTTLQIDGHIPLDGFSGPPNAVEAPDEGGFADAQIDATGTLYAAHRRTGRVLVYDTVAQRKLPEITVGRRPWVVFAEHPFPEVSRRFLVPNFGDLTVSVIDGQTGTMAGTLPGDEQAYGVNYSSLVPDQAFVMNRVRQDIAVMDRARMAVIDRIPVGGTTETASTTADGRYIVAAVSSANAVVVIDARTRQVVRRFSDVGRFPWTVTIPGGQNYCH